MREAVKFLGVVIHSGYTRLQEKKVKVFKAKLKKATRRNSQVNLQKGTRNADALDSA